MADVFFSYAREDRRAARALAEVLERAGFSVFWDRNIVVGEDFDDVIARELSTARAVAVLWTKVSVKSDWVRDEADAGKQRGALVPVALDGVRPPLGFRRIQTAFVGADEVQKASPGVVALIDGVAALVGQSVSWPEVFPGIDVESLRDVVTQTPAAKAKWARVGLVSAGVVTLALTAWTLLGVRDDRQDGPPIVPMEELAARLDAFNRWEELHEDPLLYFSTANDDQFVIAPDTQYWRALRGESVLRPQLQRELETYFQMPTLDLKVVNNSEKTIVIEEVLLEVRSSRPDPWPVLAVHSQQDAFSVLIENEGWGDVFGCVASFTLVAPGEAKWPTEYGFREDLGDFKRSVSVPLDEALTQKGVDVEALRAVRVECDGESIKVLREGLEPLTFDSLEEFRAWEKNEFAAARGPFTAGTVLVRGELSFLGEESPGGPRANASLRLETGFDLHIPVYDRPILFDKPLLVSHSYEQQLREKGDDYSVRVPVSHSVEAGAPDRFTVELGVSRSSRHHFDVSLGLLDGRRVEIGEVDLRAQLTREDELLLED